MIHCPCDRLSEAQCLRDGKCSKKFPKQFNSETALIEVDVSNKRKSPQNGGETAKISSTTVGDGRQEIKIDDSWVVLDSPELFRNFRTHMNIELCISKVGSI